MSKDKENSETSLTAGLRARLDTLLEGIQVIDFDWRYVYLNDIMLHQAKVTREELLGNRIMDKFPGIEHTEMFQSLAHVMETREPAAIENRFVFPDGSSRWFDLSIEPAPEGICVLSLDITPYKDALDNIRRSKSMYAFLSQINQSIVHSKTEKRLLDTACRIAVDQGKFSAAWIGFFDRDKKQIVSKADCGFGKRAALPASIAYSPRDVHGQVLKSGRHQIQLEGKNPLKNTRKKLPFLISLPLYASGRVMGVFDLYSAEPHFAGSEEIALLLEVAGDISFALDHLAKAKKQREIEKRIEENEKKFRSLIEKSADMKTMASRDGKLLYGSPSITRVLGYEPEDTDRFNIFDLIHPDDQLVYAEQREKLYKQPGGFFRFEMRLRHKKGHWIWCEGTATNLLDEPGVEAVVSNFIDITDKKKAEKQIEFDRNNLYALINNTEDLQWSVDTQMRLITTNRAFDELMLKVNGRLMLPGEFVMHSKLDADSIAMYTSLYKRAFEGEIFCEIVQLKRNEGTWWEISFHPIKEDGKILGSACHARNISEQRELERNLQQSIQELTNYKYALDEASIVAITDLKGTITHVNENFCQISKFTREELIGQDHRIINSGYHPKEFIRGLWTTIAKGNIWRGEIRNRAKDGTIYWVETAIVPLLDEKGKPLRYIAIRSDVTARKLAEEQLIRNNVELSRTNTELDRFVYSISHDLRAPLTSIRGLLSIMSEETNEQATREHLDMINGRIDRLDIFIKNVLDHSRTNRAEIMPVEIDLEALTRDVIEALSGIKTVSGVDFRLSFEGMPRFYSDAQSVRTLLENLVSNAVKFQQPAREQKFIAISGDAYADGIKLTVSDNGIGIPLEQQQKVFDMFYRLPGQQEGSGIGLYIVKQIVEKLNGAITLISQPGHGTSFEIYLKNLNDESSKI